MGWEVINLHPYAMPPNHSFRKLNMFNIGITVSR